MDIPQNKRTQNYLWLHLTYDYYENGIDILIHFSRNYSNVPWERYIVRASCFIHTLFYFVRFTEICGLKCWMIFIFN